MLAIQGDAEAHGAVVVLSSTVDSGVYDAKHRTFVVRATQNGDQHELACDYFVNATGIFAPLLLDKFVHREAATKSVDTEAGSGNTHTLPDLPTLPELFAKGTYFKLRESVRPFRFVWLRLRQSLVGVEGSLQLCRHLLAQRTRVPNPRARRARRTLDCRHAWQRPLRSGRRVGARNRLRGASWSPWLLATLCLLTTPRGRA